MADVFISYARADAVAASQLASALTSDGLAVWWDGMIDAQASWEATIESELSAAKALVVLWSESSVVSENVKAEARQASTRLVQVFLDNSRAPLFFGERQGLGLAKWDGSKTNHYIVLLEAIRRVVAGTQATKQAIGSARQREPDGIIDENDPRYLALSPMDRVSLSLSPLDITRTETFKRKLGLARERTRLAGVKGGLINWLVARLSIDAAKRQCRRDERWHRRHVRARHRNELVRELQLAYVIDVFDDRLESIRALERELG